MSWVGSSVPRVEDPALLSGRGEFIDDFHLPDMLHAAVVRSPYAHAKVGKIDCAEALAMPGVHAVLTQDDLPQPFRDQRLLLLVPNPAIRNLIREDKVAQMYSAIQTGQAIGMQTMDQCLQGLVEKRIITVEAAREKARQPDSITS